MMLRRLFVTMSIALCVCGCNPVQAAETPDSAPVFVTATAETPETAKTEENTKEESKNKETEQEKEIMKYDLDTMFSKEQKKELEKYFSQFLDSVKEDGTAEVFIPSGSGLTAKDLVQYMTAYDFGEVYRNTTYKNLKGSTGTKLKGSVNPELKKQNDLVKQYIVSETEGMGPTLENAKLLYEKIVNGFTYEMNDTWGVNVLLETGKGKCCDFAILYNAMLKEIGIEGYCAAGTNTNPDGSVVSHMWNVFVLDDSVYTVDITSGMSHKEYGLDMWEGFKETDSCVLNDTYHLENLI